MRIKEPKREGKVGRKANYILTEKKETKYFLHEKNLKKNSTKELAN